MLFMHTLRACPQGGLGIGWTKFSHEMLETTSLFLSLALSLSLSLSSRFLACSHHWPNWHIAGVVVVAAVAIETFTAFGVASAGSDVRMFSRGSAVALLVYVMPSRLTACIWC